MEVFIGTSGWFYDWNEEKSLDWFIAHSGLNAVELNASFYRFPFPNQVAAWAKKGKDLKWAVKVHRLITHRHKFNAEAVLVWERFVSLFEPLDKLISFYLFQAPPNLNDTNRILKFAAAVGLDRRFALELRNKELLQDEETCRRLQKKVTLVSLDSPDFYEKIFPGKVIYLRMHGRTAWYQHDYSKDELKKIAQKICAKNPKTVYVFFNNNHNMLSNAQEMLKILRQ